MYGEGDGGRRMRDESVGAGMGKGLEKLGMGVGRRKKGDEEE